VSPRFGLLSDTCSSHSLPFITSWS
jgi:hypothetical protein